MYPGLSSDELEEASTMFVDDSKFDTYMALDVVRCALVSILFCVISRIDGIEAVSFIHIYWFAPMQLNRWAWDVLGLTTSRFSDMSALTEKFDAGHQEAFAVYEATFAILAKQMKASTMFLVEAQLHRHVSGPPHT